MHKAELARLRKVREQHRKTGAALDALLARLERCMAKKKQKKAVLRVGIARELLRLPKRVKR